VLQNIRRLPHTFGRRLCAKPSPRYQTKLHLHAAKCQTLLSVHKRAQQKKLDHRQCKLYQAAKSLPHSLRAKYMHAHTAYAAAASWLHKNEAANTGLATPKQARKACEHSPQVKSMHAPAQSALKLLLPGQSQPHALPCNTLAGQGPRRIALLRAALAHPCAVAPGRKKGSLHTHTHTHTRTRATYKYSALQPPLATAGRP